MARLSPVWYSFIFVLNKSMCISAFIPSSIPNSLVILFIYSAFSLCFLFAIFLFKIVQFLLHLVTGMFFSSSPPCVIFFHCFGVFCFVCIALTFVNIFLIFLFFIWTFWFISSICMVIFYCVDFSFWFLHSPASFYHFIILASFLRFFLSAFPVGFPVLVLIFPSCFLAGSQYFPKLITLLHRLVHLIRLNYSLTYKVVLDLFYTLPSKLISILWFLMMLS